MFLPSGSALIACTVAPSRCSSAGASSEAAPLAQSTTTLIPCSGAWAASTRWAKYRSRPSPIGSVWPGRSAASCGPASTASISSSIASAQLRPGPVEELDAVVFGRVVGRRDHDPRRGAQGRGEERDRGGGFDAGDQGVATRVPDAFDQCVLEPFAGGTRVSAYHERRMTLAVAAEDDHRGIAQSVGEVLGELLARETAYAVGAEQSSHQEAEGYCTDDGRRIGRITQADQWAAGRPGGPGSAGRSRPGSGGRPPPTCPKGRPAPSPSSAYRGKPGRRHRTPS